MFKFNFIPDTEENDTKKSETETESVPASVNENDECSEILPTQEQEDFDFFSPALIETLNSMSFQNKHKVFHVQIEDIIDKLVDQSDDLNRAEESHSDLIAGVYEGGAKVWECIETVGDFLTKTVDTKRLIDDFKDSSVLDLGCGAGILGILALQNGASVHFQDYNKVVLQHVTIPNVLANTKCMTKLKQKCRFYSGDWSNYATKTVDGEKFDFILTSETIYNVQNYSKIIKILKEKLKPSGVCYLAAKLHYLGVGGSLIEFEQNILKESIFKSECVLSCSDNVAREIIKITFK